MKRWISSTKRGPLPLRADGYQLERRRIPATPKSTEIAEWSVVPDEKMRASVVFPQTVGPGDLDARRAAIGHLENRAPTPTGGLANNFIEAVRTQAIGRGWLRRFCGAGKESSNRQSNSCNQIMNIA